MLTIFHLPSTGSFRSIWLACELGLTFKINRREDSKNPADNDTHPLSKAPMLLDGSISIATHGAAREYLLSSYDRSGMRPPMAHPDYIQYLQWVHYLEGTLLPLVDQQRIINKLGQSRVPFFARSIMKKTVLNYTANNIEPEINRQLNYINESLGESGWTCGGQFCAADIDLAYILLGLQSEGKLQSSHKNIEMFLNTIKERPTYQLAEEKATITAATLSYEKEAAEPEGNQEPTAEVQEHAEPTLQTEEAVQHQEVSEDSIKSSNKQTDSHVENKDKGRI